MARQKHATIRQLHAGKAVNVKALAMKQCRTLQLTTLMTQLHRTGCQLAYDDYVGMQVGAALMACACSGQD